MKKLISVFVLLAMMFSLSGCAGEKNVTGNTPGNIVNGGIAATDGEWIYYSNTRDQEKLYRIKPDGNDKQKVSDDLSKMLNVVEGWIYYYNFLHMSDMIPIGELCRIKTDGSGRQIVD